MHEPRVPSQQVMPTVAARAGKKTGYAEVERRILKALGKIVLLAAIGAAIAVLAWTMAMPNLVCGPINAAESAASATLKNIQRAEEEFRERRVLDTDGDGKGEFGWLGELAGIAPLRGDTAGRLLDPPVLSKAFGEVQAGHVQRSDYLFCMWLPAVGGGWARQGDKAAIDADAAETQFCIYAWPANPGAHKRAFFTNASGDVFASRNTPGYLGAGRPVPIDAGFPTSDAAMERGDWGYTGRDGDPWVVIL